jgi:hypothetical protein
MIERLRDGDKPTNITRTNGCPCAWLYDDPVRAVGADTLGTDTLKEGFVFDSTAGPPLRTSISPRTAVGALVVALLKIVTTIRFHGALS